jgi:hypothetical protein
MEELFKGQIPDGDRPDIQLYIFPHLREFISVDLREDVPRVSLLNTNDLFNEEFFRCVEAEFSHTVREETDYPFDHMINLPLRLEEVIRGVAMTFVLERLGIDPHDEENLPSVVVFVISGGALALHSGQLIDSLKEFLGGYSDELALSEWTGVISRLVAEESAALQKVSQQELTDALASDSPDYFTLWESRN